MMEVPFTKLHGAENDFLLTWANEVANGGLPDIARSICARTTGMGADGWMLVCQEDDGLRTRLFNSDGSEAEISGNGTRCAAAFGLLKGIVSPPEIPISTEAGRKMLRLITRTGNRFLFEMNMGVPKVEELRAHIRFADRDFEAAILNVGNPQCVIFSEGLPGDWLAAAREAERHPRFPNRTNVSFVRILDRHTIEAVFYERGAGQTRSSGTGSMGAAAAAILRNVVESPVEVRTPAGSLTLRWEDSVYLTGPAELVGEGRFFFDF